MKFEQIVDKENTKTVIKTLAAMEDVSLTQLKVLVNHKFNKSDSLNNLTNKIRNKTIRISELLEICDVLGYEIVVRKK